MMPAEVPSCAHGTGAPRQTTSAAHLLPAEPPPDAYSPAPTLRTKSVFSETPTAGTEVTAPDVSKSSIAEGVDKSSSAPNLYTAGAKRTSEAGGKASSLPAINPSSTSDQPSTEVPANPTSNDTDTSLPQPQTNEAISAAGVESANVPDPSAALREVLQALGNGIRLRDQLFLAQSRLEQQRQMTSGAQNFLDQSQAELMQAIQHMLSSESIEESAQHARKLYEQYQSDADVHKLQSDNLKAAETELRNQEYELYQVDQELSRYIHEKFPNLPQPRPTTPDGVASGEQMPLVSPQRFGTPKILRALWKALGERDVLRDELFDLDQQHQFDAAELERIHERGETYARSEKAESVFEREYEHERQALSTRLLEATAKVELRRQECNVHGIDPSQLRKSGQSLSSNGSSSLSPLPQEADTSLEPFYQPNPPQSDSVAYKQSTQFPIFSMAERPSTSTSSDNLAQLGIAERVESWLWQSTSGQEFPKMG